MADDLQMTNVREFHEAFGHPVAIFPNLQDAALNELRINLIKEELEELMDALYPGATHKIEVTSTQRAPNDPHSAIAENVLAHSAEVIDALTDIEYVVTGAWLALGMHPAHEYAARDVHASNMSKLGDDGKPVYREDGKVMKGPNFVPPDLYAVAQSHLNLEVPKGTT